MNRSTRSERCRLLHRWPAAFVFAAVAPSADAQLYRPLPDHPPVFDGGGRLVNAGSGGFEAPHIQFIDVDGDGRPDLLVKDRDRRVKFYMHDGSTASPGWVLDTSIDVPVEIPDWFRFADIDGDGDLDLFRGGDGGSVMLHRNLGTSRRAVIDPAAVQVRTAIGDPVVTEGGSIPAFADPDGDGDLDLFAGYAAGSIVHYENTGTRTSPAFRFATDRYQNLNIVGFGGGGTAFRDSRTVHGAMALAFGDIDADGDADMLWGDFFSRSLYYLKNQGTPTAPSYVLADSTFPDVHPDISSGFNMPSLADADGDGKPDLMISVVSGFLSVRNLLYLRNTSAGATVSFAPPRFDPVSVLDIGASSRPAVGDVTGDGVPDLLLGEAGGIVRVMRGLDTLGRRSFLLTPDTLIRIPGGFMAAPAAGDLDGDGTPEIVVGDFSGRLRLFRRSGGWVEDPSFTLAGQVFGARASPALGDMDGDGDLDLVVGFTSGRLTLFENVGSVVAPSFVRRTDFLGAIDVGDDAAPAVADIDADGDADLVVGSRDGGVTVWMQHQGLFVPYPAPLGTAFPMLQATPAVLRSGTAETLVIGNLMGGLYFFERTERTVEPLRTAMLEHPVPNPASRSVRLTFTLPAADAVSITVHDMLGRSVAGVPPRTLGPGYFEHVLDTRTLRSGAYVVVLRAGGAISVRRLIILH